MSVFAFRKTYADAMNWPGTFDLCIKSPSVLICLAVSMNV